LANYAIQITFTDGHATGIFSYDHLPQYLPLRGLRQGLPRRRHLTAQRGLR